MRSTVTRRRRPRLPLPPPLAPEELDRLLGELAASWPAALAELVKVVELGAPELDRLLAELAASPVECMNLRADL